MSAAGAEAGARPATILPKRCDAPVLAIDPNGYHVAATCGGSIGTAEGSATGAWKRTMLAAPAHRTESDPQLAVDGDTMLPGLYAVWAGRRAPRPAERRQLQGSRRVLSGREASRTASGPNPRQVGRSGDTLDAFRAMDGTLHAIVLPQGVSPAVYEQVGDGSTTRVRLPRVIRRIAARRRRRRSPESPDVDSRDGGIRLATIDGTSVDTEVVASRGTLINPLLVLGAGNQPHLVWTRDATAELGCAVPDANKADGTYYGTMVDGTWVVERITKATGPTSMVLDTDTGGVHVLVNGSPNTTAAGVSSTSSAHPAASGHRKGCSTTRSRAVRSSGRTHRMARSSSCTTARTASRC